MKKTLLIFLLSTLSTFAVHAANNTNGPWYAGFVVGLMDGGGSVTDDAINLGFTGGYQINRYFAPELELTRTIVDGKTSGGNDWDVDTLSIFAAFRTDTKVKFKAKIGISDIESGNNSDTELSLGIGIGFWALGGLTEIEYTELSDDYDLEFLSFGVKYFF